MAEDPVETCSTCGAQVQRVIHPVAVHFKGSGFYTTDYGKRRAPRRTAPSADKSESKSDSKSDTKSDSKSDSGKKPESKSSS